MEPVTCPRCRTAIQAADGTLRCPACGARTRNAIMAELNARPKSTAIATGVPAPARPPTDEPESELDRLTAHSRRRRHSSDHLGGGGDEGDTQRIGRMLMLLRSLPVIVGLLCVLLLPVFAFATLASLGREMDLVPIAVSLVLCVVASLSLYVGYVWLRSRWANRDDEDTEGRSKD